MIPKAQAIQLLSEQLSTVKGLRQGREEDPAFTKWKSLSKSLIARLFGDDSRQHKEFEKVSYSPSIIFSGMSDHYYHQAYLSGLDKAEAQLEAMVQEIETFWPNSTATTPISTTPLDTVRHLLGRFHTVARQLKSRHGKRATLTIKDRANAS